ncbi:MAG TPA: glycoside hydrolase 43 family protein [Paludibacter sp.]
MKKILFYIFFFSIVSVSNAQQTAQWGDQGNRTFRNPVLAGDYSDPDIIRVGNDYYGISSTLEESPGMIVIHSKDLVNWEIIGHVVADISQLSSELNWNSMKGYDQGVYAGSLRFHDNKYYCHFTTKKNGWWVAVADRPEGPWTITQMTDMNNHPLNGFGWDDNCPLWDDDGNAYIIASNFGKYEWCPRIFKMSADGKQLLDGRIGDKSENDKYLDIIGGYMTHPYRTSEANKMFKRNGYYYFFFSEVRKADGFRPRIPVLLRSKKIYGPYELKEILHSQGVDKDFEPNQGSLVDTPDGKDWYFVTHHGTGHFSGRFLSVLSMKWVNDWPEIGKDIDNDGVGEMVWEEKMPNLSNPDIKMQTSDDFNSLKLGLQWQWNHQPRADKWSLTEHPGYLRLSAFKPLDDKNFFTAGNTIGQRYYRCANSVATVKLEIKGMANGQDAGLCQYDGGKCFTSLGLVMDNGQKKIIYKRGEYRKDVSTTLGDAVPKNINTVYFRIKADFNGVCNFEYSFDNKKYSAFGTTSQLTWAFYRGTRFGIYNYNSLQDSGFVDMDSFEYQLKNR